MPKLFSKFVSECRRVSSPTKDTVDLKKQETRNELNSNLLKHLNIGFDSPDIALARVRRELELYGVNLPKISLYSNDTKESITHIQQYGVDIDYYCYFTYELSKDGSYDCFAAVTDENGLNSLVEDDIE